MAPALGYRNPIFDLLCELGVSDHHRVVPFYPRTRDREDVAVYRCGLSDVIFLGSTDHMSIVHYDNKAPTHKHGKELRQIVSTNDDSLRRKARFANLIRGRRWLDVGAGSGAMLDALASLAVYAGAVEPQEEAASTLQQLGYDVYRRLEHVSVNDLDVVSFFHVLEHLEDPLSLLKQCRKVLKPGGQLIVEVPHARDFLIHFANDDAFKAHTFWSEHLILHTRASLTALLQAAGYTNIVIEGVQRYPLANHLHWLIKGEPAGHIRWSALRDSVMDESYGSMLARLDMTDTLIATAFSPA